MPPMKLSNTETETEEGEVQDSQMTSSPEKENHTPLSPKNPTPSTLTKRQSSLVDLINDEPDTKRLRMGKISEEEEKKRDEEDIQATIEVEKKAAKKAKDEDNDSDDEEEMSEQYMGSYCPTSPSWDPMKDMQEREERKAARKAAKEAAKKAEGETADRLMSRDKRKEVYDTAMSTLPLYYHPLSWLDT